MCESIWLAAFLCQGHFPNDLRGWVSSIGTIWCKARSTKGCIAITMAA